jgi:hypothetical protein
LICLSIEIYALCFSMSSLTVLLLHLHIIMHI